MRRSIDQIRDYLYGGGYPDPVSNAEQLSFLFFFYLVEGIDSDNQRKARVLKRPYESLFSGEWAVKNPLNADNGGTVIPRERFKWSVWAKAMSGEALVRFVRDEVFAFFTEMGGRSATNFMDGARLSITDPTVLTQVVNLVDNLHLDDADADTKGDLFEHVLRQIRQAGELGQFRTPRHVIRMVTAIVDPKIGETVYDPAAGTAGFLVAAYNHIRLANSSENTIQDVEVDGKTVRRGMGDRLSAVQGAVLQTGTFYGNDVDPKMVRLATMNLTLRGLPNVRVLLRNVLTTSIDAERRESLGLPAEGYHVILANPPFSGRVDKDRVVEDVKVGNSTATELLFLKYMMDNLRDGGRCGVVIFEGVLFGSTSAHRELRRQLVENFRVEAVISLPGGVFQPYSVVKTSVLVFRKGGTTDNVLFLHVDNDGYKLDANHDAPIDADDLPHVIETYQNRAVRLVDWQERDATAEWTEKWWFADAETIRAADFNLSAGRYRPTGQAALDHADPRELLDELAAVESEIVDEVAALRATLGDAFNNPGGWPITTIGDVILSLDYGSSAKASSEPNGLPMIRMGNVTYDGKLDLSDLKYVDLSEQDAERFGLLEGDILFNRTNSKELVGKTGIWDGRIPAIVASYFIRVRVNPERVRPRFLWAFMNSPHMKRVLFNTARGAVGQANINSKELKAFPIPLPPMDIQLRFEEQCVALEDLMAQQATARDKTKAMFDGLLAQSFPG